MQELAGWRDNLKAADSSLFFSDFSQKFLIFLLTVGLGIWVEVFTAQISSKPPFEALWSGEQEDSMYHRYLGIRQFEEQCPDLAGVARWHDVQDKLYLGLADPWKN